MREIDEMSVHDRTEPAPVSRVVPCVLYTGRVRKALKKFKFNNDTAYAKAFSFLAERRLCKLWDMYGFDAIVTMPISKERMNERGYNQSLFLAETAGRVLGIDVHNEYLSKPSDTKRQSTLNQYERSLNVQGAYAASEKVKGKNVLLVDDIYTTGSTINEAAKTLLNAGATTVIAIVFAVRPKRKDNWYKKL